MEIQGKERYCIYGLGRVLYMSLAIVAHVCWKPAKGCLVWSRPCVMCESMKVSSSHCCNHQDYSREANRELINQSYSYKSKCLPSHSKWRCNRPQHRFQDPTYLSPLTYLTLSNDSLIPFENEPDFPPELTVQNCHFHRMNSSRTDLLWMAKWSVQYWSMSDWDHIVGSHCFHPGLMVYCGYG